MYSSPGSRERNTRGPRFSRRINRNIAGRIRGLKREGLDDGAHPLVNLLNRSGLPSGILAEPSHGIAKAENYNWDLGFSQVFRGHSTWRRDEYQWYSYVSTITVTMCRQLFGWAISSCFQKNVNYSNNLIIYFFDINGQDIFMFTKSIIESKSYYIILINNLDS